MYITAYALPCVKPMTRKNKIESVILNFVFCQRPVAHRRGLLQNNYYCWYKVSG